MLAKKPAYHEHRFPPFPFVLCQVQLQVPKFYLNLNNLNLNNLYRSLSNVLSRLAVMVRVDPEMMMRHNGKSTSSGKETKRQLPRLAPRGEERHRVLACVPSEY